MVSGSNDGAQNHESGSGVDVITRQHGDHVHRVDLAAGIAEAADGVQIVDALTVDVAHVADVVHTECAVQADESTEATDVLLHDVKQEPNFLLTEELVVEPHAPWRSALVALVVLPRAFGRRRNGRSARIRLLLPRPTGRRAFGSRRAGLAHRLQSARAPRPRCLALRPDAGGVLPRPEYPGEGLREYRVPVVTALRLMAVVAIASFAVHAAVSRLLVVVFFPSLVVACLFTRWVMRQVV